jgi:hypothetical protein
VCSNRIRATELILRKFYADQNKFNSKEEEDLASESTNQGAAAAVCHLNTVTALLPSPPPQLKALKRATTRVYDLYIEERKLGKRFLFQGIVIRPRLIRRPGILRAPGLGLDHPTITLAR